MKDKTEELREALEFIQCEVDTSRHLEQWTENHILTAIDAMKKLLAIQEAYEAGYRLVPGDATDEILKAQGDIVGAPEYLHKYGRKPYKATIDAAPDKLGEILGGGEC